MSNGSLCGDRSVRVKKCVFAAAMINHFEDKHSKYVFSGAEKSIHCFAKNTIDIMDDYIQK